MSPKHSKNNQHNPPSQSSSTYDAARQKMSISTLLNYPTSPSSQNMLDTYSTTPLQDIAGTLCNMASSSTITSSSSSSITPKLSHFRRESLCNEPSSLAARRQFARSISESCNRKGFIRCKLCQDEVWGPNGRFHLERCPIITRARQIGKQFNAKLISIGSIPVHHDVFKKGKRPPPKKAKIQGFVMSHSVSTKDPSVGLTKEEMENGTACGRKGYVRCVRCNAEVFAPNARYHASICHHTQTM